MLTKRFALLGMFLLAVSACQNRDGAETGGSTTDGTPRTLAELNEWYAAVPDAENAALVFAEASAAYRAPDGPALAVLPLVGEGELPPVTAPLTADMRAAIGPFVAKNEAARSLAAKAAAMPKSRFPLDFTQGFTLEYPHLSPCRDLTRLLALAAMLDAETGDAPGAFQNARDALRIGEVLREEPTTIAQLVRIACHGIAANATERVVNRASLADAQLRALQDIALALEYPDAFYRAMVGERCLISGELAKSPDESDAVKQGLISRDLLTPALRETTEKMIDDAIAAARLAPKERHEQLAPTMELTEESATDPAQKTAIPFVVPLLRSSIAFDVDAATSRVLACGIALRRYRVANKAWPKSLSELAPQYLSAVPDDPFSGLSLRFKTEGANAIVYSLGRDRDDDGGRQYNPDGSGTPDGDIVFVCLE